MKNDTNKFKIYDWKNISTIHWMLNPGLMINELVLGQRIPKVYLVEQTSDKPRIERTHIPCPHCETIHKQSTWSQANGTSTKNWYGLFCPTCEQTIPCVTNVFSRALLFLSYPFWGRKKEINKAKWLSKQPARYKDICQNTSNPFDRKTWWLTGLTWASFMFILMSVLYPIAKGEVVTTNSIAISLTIWTVAGLVFGLSMFLFTESKGKSVRNSKA